MSRSESPTDTELIQAAAWLMTSALGLPFPKVAMVYVCTDELTFINALHREAGFSRHEAGAHTTRMVAGISTKAGVFLRGDYLNRASLLDRAGLIAHELAHVTQREHGGPEWANPLWWVSEGHAEWVRLQVLDRLGYQGYGESRAALIRSVARVSSATEKLPSLRFLEGHRGPSPIRLPHAATYGQAFLAVEWLTDRYGSPKVLSFLGRSSRDTDPRQSWSPIFPGSYADFVESFDLRLRGMVRLEATDVQRVTARHRRSAAALGLTLDVVPGERDGW
jgi:hypothetical protein